MGFHLKMPLFQRFHTFFRPFHTFFTHLQILQILLISARIDNFGKFEVKKQAQGADIATIL